MMSGAVRVHKMSAAACSLTPARSSKRLARWRAAAAVPAARWASISSANSFRTASLCGLGEHHGDQPVRALRDLAAQPGVEGQRLARVGGGR
jgi:hypothetical protein